MKKRLLIGLVLAGAVAVLLAVPGYSGFTPVENGEWQRWTERNEDCHAANSTCWEWCHRTSSGNLWGTGDGCCFIGEPADMNDRWSCEEWLAGN